MHFRAGTNYEFSFRIWMPTAAGDQMAEISKSYEYHSGVGVVKNFRWGGLFSGKPKLNHLFEITGLLFSGYMIKIIRENLILNRVKASFS